MSALRTHRQQGSEQSQRGHGRHGRGTERIIPEVTGEGSEEKIRAYRPQDDILAGQDTHKADRQRDEHNVVRAHQTLPRRPRRILLARRGEALQRQPQRGIRRQRQGQNHRANHHIS